MMEMRDPNTMPAGLQHMQRLAVDLSVVKQRMASAEQLLVPSPYGAANTQLTSNGPGSKPTWTATPVCGRAYPTGAANHTTSGNWEKVPLDLADSPLTGITFDNPNDQLVVITAGNYAISTSVGFATSASGQVIASRPYINATPSHVGIQSPAVAVTIPAVSGVKVYALAAGDTIQMWAFQNIATPRAYTIDSSYTYMSVWQVG